jgi:hypothetical protein
MRPAPVAEQRRLTVVQPGNIRPLLADRRELARIQHVGPQFAARIGRKERHVHPRREPPEQRELLGREVDPAKDRHAALAEPAKQASIVAVQQPGELVVRMHVADLRQAFEQPLPEPALPGLVRAQRPFADCPLPPLPAREPVAPIRKVALEAHGERVGERQPLQRALVANTPAQQLEIGVPGQLAEQLHQHPSDPLGLERGPLRQVGHRRAHRPPEPSSRELRPDPRADAVPACIAALEPAADADTGHDHRGLRQWIARRAVERIEQRVGQALEAMIEANVQRHARSASLAGARHPATQKPEPGSRRNASSASDDGRPRIALRCGKRPKRSMTS